jgi:hypothetical protein
MRNLSVVLAFVMVSPAFGGDDPKALAQAVRDARFPDDKLAAARLLAASKSDEGHRELLGLWQEGDNWTQEAAEYALVLVEDPGVDDALCEKIDGDLSAKSALLGALKERKTAFRVTRLVARLKEATWEPDQNRIVDALGLVGGAEARAALIEVAREGAKGPERHAVRAKALGALLTAGKPDEIRPVALEVLDDPAPDVAASALAVVVETGTAADLPRVLGLLGKRTAEADAPVAAIAYRGVAKWGDAKVKLETLLGGLGSKDERRAQAAIAVFGDVGGAEVQGELCRLVRRGVAQETRLAAADRLVGWPAAPAGEKDPVVPYLVTALKEKFDPKDEGGLLGTLAKRFLTIATAGLFDVLDAWNRHATKEAIEASVKGVAASLAKRTGADPGATHEAWTDWAVDHGYTVEGDNLVARLFSGYPQVRRKARESAARLVGSAPANASETDVALELARRLMAKGFPQDERY